MSNKIRFLVHAIRPDMRQYRQQSVEIAPEQLWVEMEVAEEHIRQYAENGEVPTAISVAGLKSIMDQFDRVFMEVETPKPQNDYDDFDDGDFEFEDEVVEIEVEIDETNYEFEE